MIGKTCLLRSLFALENYNFWSSQVLIVSSGWAPTNSSTIFPSLNNFTAGIDITPNFEAASVLSSVEAFARMNLPSYSLASFWSVGFSVMQGPHHVAQKSTRTGVVFDFSITSFSNVASVTSISI
jgi:hypothetical protein